MCDPIHFSKVGPIEFWALKEHLARAGGTYTKSQTSQADFAYAPTPLGTVGVRVEHNAQKGSLLLTIIEKPLALGCKVANDKMYELVKRGLGREK